jgi:hypothetical protein
VEEDLLADDKPPIVLFDAKIVVSRCVAVKENLQGCLLWGSGL